MTIADLTPADGADGMDEDVERWQFALSCWVPRTHMHQDEVAALQEAYVRPADLDHLDEIVVKKYSTYVLTDNVMCYDTTAWREADGHLYVVGEIQQVDDPRSAQRALREWWNKEYRALTKTWPVMFRDVNMGLVKIGCSGMIGQLKGDRLHTTVADPSRLDSAVVPVNQLRSLLLTEACREYVASSLEKFRELQDQLDELREDASSRPVSEVAEISVKANEQISTIRTVIVRLDVAGQTIRNRLQHPTTSVEPYTGNLSDLLLVVDYMLAVWSTQANNFEWVVQHISLRASIAERNSVRNFTAAVFSVAVLALLRDALDLRLVFDDFTWSASQLGSAALTILGVLGVAYGSFRVVKRVFP